MKQIINLLLQIIECFKKEKVSDSQINWIQERVIEIQSGEKSSQLIALKDIRKITTGKGSLSDFAYGESYMKLVIQLDKEIEKIIETN
jgi:hypothetical protein